MLEDERRQVEKIDKLILNTLKDKMKISKDKINIISDNEIEKIFNKINEKMEAIFLLFEGNFSINEMNLEEVCFHGSVENVNEYLKASDLFILPSKYEGLPVTLVEAQSAGVKCLVSNGVPTEADFNLGLMEALPLEKDSWVTRIKQCVFNKKRIAQSDIESAIRNRGYDIRDSANKMLEVYL